MPTGRCNGGAVGGIGRTKSRARRAAAFAIALCCSAAAAGTAAAQRSPERFAPGVVSTDGSGETWIAFEPDGRTVYFSRYDGDAFDRQTVYETRLAGDAWSPPTVASFSGRYGDRAVRISPDGRRLVFSSDRPLAGSQERRWRLWLAEKGPGATWSSPVPLPAPVNAGERDYHGVFTADGALYWASVRPGGRGRSDVYRSVPAAAGWSAPEQLPAPINTAGSEPDLYVSPDGRFMILVATDREGGYGGDDLWISHRTSRGWTEPRNLGPAVNTAEYEYGPVLSPDGAWLYFTSHRTGGGDIYRIPTRELDLAPRSDDAASSTGLPRHAREEVDRAPARHRPVRAQRAHVGVSRADAGERSRWRL